ncbi:arylsulfatase-like [Styela clava]
MITKSLILIFVAHSGLCVAQVKRSPNIIIFLADDLGYGDLAAYGNTEQESGPLEKMAQEGVRFTQWTSPSFACTPSRSALLTGRYAVRSGVYGNSSRNFTPTSTGGLPASEITIAEVLKPFGYTTGMVGKWHLGINQATSTDGVHLPHNQGFDYVGSNFPFTHSKTCDGEHNVDNGSPGGGKRQGGRRARRRGRSRRQAGRQSGSKLCFRYEGSQIVEQPYSTSNLTQKFVEDAISFVKTNKDNKFFLYVALPQPHPVWFCNSDFCGKSKRGEYGDVLNEMAWAVGKVLDQLKTLGIDKDTLAIFASDHGARQPTCDSTWSNGPFRGGKGTTWEGGIRVPAIAWWPGTLPANTISNTFINHLDIWPTAVKLAGGFNYLTVLKSTGYHIDGQSIPDLMSSISRSTPQRNQMFYYCSDRLMAVRYGNYKVLYRTMGEFATTSGCDNSEKYSCYGDDIVEHNPPIVVDLVKSPGETVAENNYHATTKFIILMASRLVHQHESTKNNIQPSQLDLATNDRLSPCCNPPSCFCSGSSR